MKIATFKNRKGILYGKDTKRIIAKNDGILRIGPAEIEVNSIEERVFPELFYGGTGEYHGTFTDVLGREYDLGKIVVRAGRVVPPSPTAVEIAELRIRADIAETERDEIRAEIENLKNIFDTNSLNFLIKGEE